MQLLPNVLWGIHVADFSPSVQHNFNKNVRPAWFPTARRLHVTQTALN